MITYVNPFYFIELWHFLASPGLKLCGSFRQGELIPHTGYECRVQNHLNYVFTFLFVVFLQQKVQSTSNNLTIKEIYTNIVCTVHSEF